MTPKQVVQQLLEILPDACTYEDITRHIEVFDKLRREQEAVMLDANPTLEIDLYREQ